jgi:hypothetical protein
MDSYNLYKNGVSVDNGSLDSEEPFYAYSLLGDLAIGSYNYTLWVNDTSGNVATDEVIVLVIADDVAPIIVYEPLLVTYPQGEDSIIRNWTVTDDFKDTYSISVDGIIIEEGDWTSETIEFNFAGLAMGEHTVILTVTDLGGNSVTSSVSVLVTPSNASIAILAIFALAGVIIVAGVIVWFIKYR